MARKGRSLHSEFIGTVVFGAGLISAAGLNFLFFSLMGRMLSPSTFGSLGVLIAALVTVIGPVNAVSGGAEMFSALRNQLPRGKKRYLLLGAAVPIWAGTMMARSPTVRSPGWFALGAAALILIAWNRGALEGLGRFSFVGLSFFVEGVARVTLAVSLVALGLGLEGAAAGLVLGIMVGLVMTELSARQVTLDQSEPIGREVIVALVGLFALGCTQVVDVFAIKLANSGAAGPYVGAASIGRIALFSQMPAAVYVLRRAAVAGPLRAVRPTLALSLVPGGIAIAVIELFPSRLLRIAYGSRYLASAGTLRILGVAMLLGGFATVAAQLLMGIRSTRWVSFIVPVSILSCSAIFLLAHAPASVAVFSLAIQASAFLVIALPALRAVRTRRPSEGGVVILNWRDTRHPQGGGSEVYVEQLAKGLAASGRDVLVFCAAHPNAPRREVRDGIHFIRRGGWLTVYPWAFLYHLFGRFGPHDVVIDVKNGVPFFAPLYCRRTVICLVHHIHREQWSMNFPPHLARIGWWIESRLSPRVYERTTYVTVSRATKLELCQLGVDPAAVQIVFNGGEPVRPFVPKAEDPTVMYLGRLVPHKRVELLLDAAAKLRIQFPTLRVVVAGLGPWQERLAERARDLGISDAVTFTGWVDEETKYRLLSEAWVLAMPSVTEGWCLAVMEAAACRTPAIGFRVGGLNESIEHEVTGLLVLDQESLISGLDRLVGDPELRARLGERAAIGAAGYSWAATVERFEHVIRGRAEARNPLRVEVMVPAETLATDG